MGETKEMENYLKNNGFYKYKNGKLEVWENKNLIKIARKANEIHSNPFINE